MCSAAADPFATGWPAPLRRVLGPLGPEVSCERCFALLDEYVELEIAAGEPHQTLPEMRAHLDGCPACMEDYESLRALVAAGRALGHGSAR